MSEAIGQLKYLRVDSPDELPFLVKNGVQVRDIIFLEWTPKSQRESLIARVKEVGGDQVQVAEEIAYLWFNRFIALRYMEVNNFLSFGTRVVSSSDSSKNEPDIIANAQHLSGLPLKEEKIYEFLDKSDKSGLYKYVMIAVCNSLHKELPFMFEKIADYSELLFPENLLSSGGFLDLLVHEVDEADWKEVEILGWLYQYYISEKKDLVFAEMKNENKKISKENIPAATQLFTPKWIVKYMVENSVGKTWLESHPNPELQAKWKYYIPSEGAVVATKNLSPEDISVLDPAMGSGHILVYAFEVLHDIYMSAGYLETEIPRLILEKNLFGLEIDDRAWQLACFAVCMKARKYDRRILKEPIVLNLCSVQEIRGFEGVVEPILYPNLSQLCVAFRDGKLLGSLVVLKGIDWSEVDAEFEKFKQENAFERLVQELPRIIEQARIMEKKFSCVVSNPPYMGAGGMDKDLAEYLKKQYPDTKSNLFSAFMERNFGFSKSDGLISMITMDSWMFLSSFEVMRKSILEEKTILSMAHLWTRAFKEISGEVVQSTAFTLRNEFHSENEWVYVRLVDIKDADRKATEFVTWNYRFIQKQNNFSSIPGSPIAYWITNNVKKSFEKSLLKEFGNTKKGVLTWNDAKYLRMWHEVNYAKIGHNLENYIDSIEKNFKWIPATSWWFFRKWYGNLEVIINMENDAHDIRYCNVNNFRLRDSTYYFRECITWSEVAWKFLSARYVPNGILFWNSGPVCFFDEMVFYFICLLNSKVSIIFLNFLSPTLTFWPEQVEKIPAIIANDLKLNIESISKQNISISKSEWDSREISWDFTTNELLKHKTDSSIESAYAAYFSHWREQFFTQHRNEEELNRLFIEIYGLGEEMTPEVDLEDVTLLKYEKKIIDWELVFQKDEIIKQFISYGVGCIMGRYSLDTPGLSFAGGSFDASKYSTFLPDSDGIIPVLSDEYFEDDIAARFREFVRTAFGESHLDRNLDFIANALVKKANETATERIRRYFVSEFYKDHVDRYKKRPIYWMFSSGKDKAFNALVYLHRYDKGTIGKIRMDYLHPLQWKLEGKRNTIDARLIWADGKQVIELEKEKRQAITMIDSLKKYDEKLKHIAEQKIELDLDDGVKVNYPRFWDLLESIKL